METALEKQEQERKGHIRAVLSFVFALGIVVVGVLLAVSLVFTRPKPAQQERERPVPTVVTQPLEIGRHEVRIESEGVVESRREVSLAAEVGGRVESVAEALEAGGEVKAGDVLVEIDAADYRAALAAAESSLAEARRELALEEARGEQARKDWEKLGRGEPGDLVLRVPQIQSATARVGSARAEVERAARDVERTKIRAPFDGRVRQKGVEVGAVVTPGTMVAELFSDTELEVRLPFSLRDYGFLDQGALPEVELSATLGVERRVWPGRLVRLEGEVERETLSGYGIARVLPAPEGDRFPPVGLFVDAVVPGRTLDEVAEVPRSVLRGEDEVWVVSDGRLRRREVEVLRANRDALVVKGNFESGDRLLLTRLSAPVDGMEVRIENEGESQATE